MKLEDFQKSIPLIAYNYFKDIINRNSIDNKPNFDASIGFHILINETSYDIPVTQNLDIVLSIYQHHDNFILGLSSKNKNRSKHKVWLDKHLLSEVDKIVVTLQKLIRETPSEFELDAQPISLDTIKEDFE